ncbi:tetratricopeptide repeat protein 14 homolog [Belonocnema kinseyi]|uniref:tetratricopeptide repeat protein 14 homolog n=1 Tax=Belonocnema kinseyi TaxID=2817044 RepID=UPI00143CC1E9|nr:tetratricopeptide repeat protein 14 homolog [Belonocnema kinseyi]XP_033207660.1 tetratricopeptide repeat protein 14 homolog [Belonocnema kinseyi]
MESMEGRLVAQALNYHGQQLQKVWESDRNESELAKLNLKEPSFEIFQQRQKTLSLADIGKRLKLQQFIAKKANVLYDKANLEATVEATKPQLGGPELYATMPGLDSFVPMDKSQRIRNFLESLSVGDVIYAQVKGKSAAGLLLKILCNCSDCPRVVSDIGIKALILNTATVPAVDKKDVTREYVVNDMVCVCVTEVNVEAERVVAAMNVTPREGQAPHPPLGLVDNDELPSAYKKATENKGKSFESVLENSTGFNNPNNIKYLCDLMALGQENYSNMVGLRGKFPPEECSTKLRQAQAGKWAFRSVAEGIDHFKAGRHSEAFQCLNKALVVDPRNVEGLVARGALYANNCSFKKAVADFEDALKYNPTHANARKYMSETLVAMGRSFEDEEKFEEAQKAYEDCLTITPYHEEAKNSIEYIKKRMLGGGAVNPVEKFESFEVENGNENGKVEKKKRKKDRKSRSKKRQRWSSSSSSSTSGSSSSSSSESSSSSSSGSSRSASRSSSRKKKQKKERGSLSPLSKRMNQYNNPPPASSLPEMLASDSRAGTEGFEMLVRKFLHQTKDESDYEEKVRILLEETTRWKKERGGERGEKEGEKSKKKKKKERKTKDKDKEDKRSRRKKKKEERKKRKSSKDKLDRNLEVLKNSSSPDLEQLQSKLSAYYAKVGKDSHIPKRYAVNYSDMPSPLSNVEKIMESSHREDDSRRDRDREETAKIYHERDPRMSSAHQRKETQRKSFADMFEEETHLIHPETKIHSQKRPDLSEKKRRFDNFEDIDNQAEEKQQRTSFDKSLNIRKQMQRDLAEKRAAAQPPRPRSPSPLPPKEPPPKHSPLNYHSPQPSGKFQSAGTPQSSLNKSSHNLGDKFQPIGQSSRSGSYPPEPPQPRSPPPPRRQLRLSKGSRSDSDSDSERRASPRKRLSIGRPMARRMSRERPPKRYRSRSQSGSSSGSSRSRSPGKRSRSRSFSKRSGSYMRKYSRSNSRSYSRSASRSRSKSYSRSRSRSRSGERRYYRRQTRPYNNNWGNRPYHHNSRGYHSYNRGGGGQNFQNGNRYYHNNQNFRYNNRRGFQHGYNNYNNQNYRGRGQNRGGRFFHNNRQGFRDFRDNRRDFRDRRSYSRDRYSDRSLSPSPMRKVDEARDKINKILESGEDSTRPGAALPPTKRPEGPLSEGEERDYEDYENWPVNEGDSTAKVA